MRWTALLGRQDYPTDGVGDYVQFLTQALAARGYELDIVRVSWATEGRLRSLRRLWQRVQGQQGQWALVQYTALSWSRRGFPWLFVVVLWLLRIRKRRIAIVCHDSAAYQGHRLVDRVRRVCQHWVIGCAYRLGDKSILPVPLERVSWLPRDHSKAVFIPVGANISAIPTCRPLRNGHKPRTIAVFGITGDGSLGSEVSDIAFVAKAAAEHLPLIRLTTLGRGSAESETRLRQALEDSAVEYSALGILTAQEVARVLGNSDVSLFVRGPISTQRGSAIASIACGIPLVAYSHPPLPLEFSEGGVIGVSVGDREALAEAAIRVLTDSELWLELHRRNRLAFEAHFAWETIATRFARVLADA
jgi:glycosyltransferase involved in cell wall biosynthesis